MSQQLIKKGSDGRYSNVMPKSWIEAIKDKSTGQTLVEILQGFNMYFLPYNGNTSATRCLVPMILRKKGLWITYVKYDGNVYTEWYAASDIDDKSWGDSSNWRIGNNTLVGDITISSNGNWVINGAETEFKAVGEKGNTPLIRVANNRLQVSYDLGDTYRNVTENPVYTQFRNYNNKIQVSTDLGATWTDASDEIAAYFRWQATTGDTQANNVGRLQISRDKKTWTNLSNDIINNLHISKYIGANESLPTSGIAEGTIYAKGPTYAVEDTSNSNPIYRLWVYAWKGNTLAWLDNGEFTSIAAGIVQELGDNENVVMSQKAITKVAQTLFTNNNIVVSEYVLEQGYMLKGTAHSDIRWVYDDRFIPIVNGETIVLAGNTYGIGIDYYDANKESIGEYWGYVNQQGVKLFSVNKEGVAFMKISYTNGESLSPNTFSPVVIQRNKDNIYLKFSEFSTNQIDLSSSTLTFSSSPSVVYEGVEYAQSSGTYSIPSTGSALKNLVFNVITKVLSIKNYNNIDVVNDKVLGYFIVQSSNILAHNLPFLFSVNGVYNVFDGDNVPMIRFGNNMNTLPNINTVSNRIEFPAMCSVIYSGKDYPLNNYDAANIPIGIATTASIMKLLVFNKITKQVYTKEYNKWMIQEYPLGWFIYNPNTKLGSYHFPFEITIDGKKTNSENKADGLGFVFKDKIDYQGHMFMRYIGKNSADPIIPSQTIFDVQLCARLGIRSIEANCLGTATAGKYVVMHGGDPNYADVGYQLVLKKSVYDADPSAFPIPEGETLIPYGDDAYYYPWDNIPNTSYDRLRDSYFNRSQYPKYRVPITELTEFLTECNKYNIMPIVTYVDSTQLQLIKQIMGNNYAIRNGSRVSNALHIYWDGTNRTASEILTLCNRYGTPFMYGMGVNVARQKTDDQLKEIVALLHDNGYLIVSDVNYYTEEDGQRLKNLGFDGQTTDWNVPFIENGNILNCSADINFSDYNTSGAVTEGTLVLSNEETVSSKNDIDLIQVGKAQLSILYNGDIDITFGEIKMQSCISNGENTLVLTSKLINRAPLFNIKANGNVSIYNIIYKVSKC